MKKWLFIFCFIFCLAKINQASDSTRYAPLPVFQIILPLNQFATNLFAGERLYISTLGIGLRVAPRMKLQVNGLYHNWDNPNLTFHYNNLSLSSDGKNPTKLKSYGVKTSLQYYLRFPDVKNCSVIFGLGSSLNKRTFNYNSYAFEFNFGQRIVIPELDEFYDLGFHFQGGFAFKLLKQLDINIYADVGKYYRNGNYQRGAYSFRRLPYLGLTSDRSFGNILVELAWNIKAP